MPETVNKVAFFRKTAQRTKKSAFVKITLSAS